MKKINWSKRSQNPKDLLCVGERVAYACSNTGIAFSYCLLLSFMTFYYTDVVGISAGVLGTIMLISRLFDGITDLVAGWMVDRTRSRIGKTRPWLIIMAVPHAAACVLAFTVPEGLGEMQQYIYIFVTYNLANAVTYTLSNIPIWAANCLLTDNSEEHTKSGIWMQVGGTASLFLVQYTCVSLVTKLGGDRSAWTMAIAFYSLVGAALMIVSGVFIRERVVTSPEEVHIPLAKRLSAIFHNKYWVLFTLTWLISGMQLAMIDSGCVYYASYELNDIDKYSTLASVQSLIQLFFLIVGMTWLIKKLGNVKVVVLSYLLIIIGSVIQIFTGNWVLILVCNAMKGAGVACSVGAQGAMMADACNYGSRRAGFDTSGIGNAGINFGSKVGVGLASLVTGWTLALFQYDGTAAVQTAKALIGVNSVYLYIPIFLGIIGILLMVPYDLYRKIEKGEIEL